MDLLGCSLKWIIHTVWPRVIEFFYMLLIFGHIMAISLSWILSTTTFAWEEILLSRRASEVVSQECAFCEFVSCRFRHLKWYSIRYTLGLVIFKWSMWLFILVHIVVLKWFSWTLGLVLGSLSLSSSSRRKSNIIVSSRCFLNRVLVETLHHWSLVLWNNWISIHLSQVDLLSRVDVEYAWCSFVYLGGVIRRRSVQNWVLHIRVQVLFIFPIMHCTNLKLISCGVDVKWIITLLGVLRDYVLWRAMLLLWCLKSRVFTLFASRIGLLVEWGLGYLLFMFIEVAIVLSYMLYFYLSFKFIQISNIWNVWGVVRNRKELLRFKFLIWNLFKFV